MLSRIATGSRPCFGPTSTGVVCQVNCAASVTKHRTDGQFHCRCHAFLQWCGRHAIPWCDHGRQMLHQSLVKTFVSALWSAPWQFVVAGQYRGYAFRMHIRDLDFIKIRDCFLNIFHRNLTATGRQNIFQRFFGSIQCNRLIGKAGISQHPFQSAFQLPHIGADMLGHKKGHIGIELKVFTFCFFIRIATRISSSGGSIATVSPRKSAKLSALAGRQFLSDSDPR